MKQTEKGLKVSKGYIETFLRQNPSFCDSEYTYFHGENDFLITPESIYKRRIAYKIHEIGEMIDSSNMNIFKWQYLSTLIYDNYDNYDSFILLHGTDTMSYTASALSFMFENLTKSIVLTGSQLPLCYLRSDGYSNLLNSLIIAGHFDIPEVLVIFENKIFRGNRSKKMNSDSFSGFDSPNFDPLVKLGVDFEINWENILLPEKKIKTSLFSQMSDKIGVIKFTPYPNDMMLQQILQKGNIEAVVIESFGSGNLPNENKGTIDVIRSACENGIIVVSLSQCYKYTTNIGVYEAGTIFGDIGVISGMDMTLEAAMAKLSYLLGKRQQNGYSLEWVKHQMLVNLRGELTQIDKAIKYQVQEEHFLETLTSSMNNPEFISIEIKQLIQSLVLPNIICFMARLGFDKFLFNMDKQKIDFNLKDYNNRTALHIAAGNNNVKIVKYLLEQEIEINAIDNIGRSPLYESVLSRNLEVSQLIFNKGGKIICDQDELVDLLISYVHAYDLQMIKMLHYYGINSYNTYLNIDNKNIGHFAVALNHVNIVLFLKNDTQFDFMQKDRWNMNCLDIAQQFGFKKIENLIKQNIKNISNHQIKYDNQIIINNLSNKNLKASFISRKITSLNNLLINSDQQLEKQNQYLQSQENQNQQQAQSRQKSSRSRSRSKDKIQIIKSKKVKSSVSSFEDEISSKQQSQESIDQ